MSTTVSPRPQAVPRAVTKRDLDREIVRLVEEIARECTGGETLLGKNDLRPRWIRPADLVRRVLPFTSTN